LLDLAETHRAVLDALSAHIALIDRVGNIVLVNDAWRRFAASNGLPDPGFLVGENYLRICDQASGANSLEAKRAAAGIRAVVSGESQRFEMEYPCHPPGGPRWFRLQVDPLGEAANAGAILMHVDVTEQRQAELKFEESEAQRRDLEAKFLQSQKMEAVGRLAGGVAHDFNNALQVIIAYGELLEERLSADPEGREFNREILSAGRHAASLTRQLLALSRKQVLRPTFLDLNTVTGNIEMMLRRTIGEDITLTIEHAPEPATIEVDRGQIEQVLINLANNARDAMPAGGELFITTSTLRVDRPGVPPHGFIERGTYAVLSIRDTGSGMDQTTQAHIFEPFFTTKDPGKGTGLGLSTVYGIIKQSKGYITVDSEPGKGSEFRLYFPTVDRAPAGIAREAASGRALQGPETLLLVEDEQSLRAVVGNMLRANGYAVLSAKDGPGAIEIAANFAAPIDLLLTDVILPGSSGRILADQLRLSRPSMKVLYMSGYTEDFIVHHGPLDPHTILLEKPFPIAALLQKIRETLDAHLEPERRAEPDSKRARRRLVSSS
jgi:signal transduction histidine kinase/FixJ family two-component response regulator